MATPRKHWFRVSDAIIREPWTRDEKMTMVMLCAFLNTRWARDGLDRDEACRATLSNADLAAITGRAQRVHSERALRAFGVHVGLAISARGAHVEIHWPKYAEFQALPSRDGVEESPGVAPSLPPPPPPPLDTTLSPPPASQLPTDPVVKEPRPKRSPSGAACRLSTLLGEFLHDVPGATFKRGWQVQWAKDIDCLIRDLGGLSPGVEAEIEAGIRWLFSDANTGQFALVVRSGSALREKWPRIVAAAQRHAEHDPAAVQDRKREKRQQIAEDFVNERS